MRRLSHFDPIPNDFDSPLEKTLQETGKDPAITLQPIALPTEPVRTQKAGVAYLLELGRYGPALTVGVFRKTTLCSGPSQGHCLDWRRPHESHDFLILVPDATAKLLVIKRSWK